MTHAWEIAGCVLALAVLGIGALLFCRNLDEREMEEWWGYGE